MSPILSSLLVLATVAFNSACAKDDDWFTNSPYHSATLYACVAAPNCEVYNFTHGAAVRFIPGMEPGTADYKPRFATNKTSNSFKSSSVINPFVNFSPSSSSTLNTASSSDNIGIKAHVSIGDKHINYGSTNPADAVHHLWDMCHEGSCDSSAYTVDTSIVTRIGPNSTPQGRTLRLFAQGQYNGWDECANFVNAVVAVASTDQRWRSQSWHIHGGIHGDGDDDGTLWQGTQTSFIGSNRFVNGKTPGFMQVQVAMDPPDKGWCSIITGTEAAIAGAVNPIAGGIFGGMSVACQLRRLDFF